MFVYLQYLLDLLQVTSLNSCLLAYLIYLIFRKKLNMLGLSNFFSSSHSILDLDKSILLVI